MYLPAVYATDEPLTDPLRLGRETDWREADGGPVRGVGQRLFIVGEDAVPIMDLGNFRFDVPRERSREPGGPVSDAPRPGAAAGSPDRRRAGQDRDPPLSGRGFHAALRNSVRRDLEALLNAAAAGVRGPRT